MSFTGGKLEENRRRAIVREFDDMDVGDAGARSDG